MNTGNFWLNRDEQIECIVTDETLFVYKGSNGTYLNIVEYRDSFLRWAKGHEDEIGKVDFGFLLRVLVIKIGYGLPGLTKSQCSLIKIHITHILNKYYREIK